MFNKSTIIIVGLGNPGKKFQKTWHNIGFAVVEGLKLKIENFSYWKYEKKFSAEISQGKICNQKAILVKPHTYMNFSGKSVKKIIKNCKLQIENLIAVHDDIDLPLGKIRIVKNRGSAGHKGVESIIQELKTKNFVRFRIGVQPKTGKPKDVEKFVLQEFNKEKRKTTEKAIKETVEAIEAVIKEGEAKAMARYNA